MGRMGEKSIEKRLIRRQFTVKSFESKSWFMVVQTLYLKYNLQDFWNVVDPPLFKVRMENPYP